MPPLTKKQSTTKAGWFWQALHTEREFSAAYLNAVLADDLMADGSKAITSALELIDKFPKDVELAEDEFVAFAHGVTPSGELEITSWGGYYVIDPLSDDRVFALLISSFDNRVFWGPEKDFANKYWSECEVDYDLGPNATLSFSSNEDTVTLSFSRVFELEEGKFSNVKVKGTFGSTAISGAPKAPPSPLSKAQNTAGGTPIFNARETLVILDAQQTLLSGSEALSSAALEEDQPFVLSDDWKTYTAYAGIYKEPAVIIGVVLWLCPPLRRVCYKYIWELRRLVGSGIENCLQWKKGHISGTHVDLARAIDSINEAVTQKLNEKLRNADFSTLLENLKQDLMLSEIAHTEMDKSLKEYIKEHLQVIANQDVADMPGDLAKRMELEVPNWVKTEVDQRSAAVMDHFRTSSKGIDAIVTTTAMQARKQYYFEHVETLNHKLEVIDSFVKMTQDHIKTQQKEILYWEKRAEDLMEMKQNMQAESAKFEAEKLKHEIEKQLDDIKNKEAEKTKNVEQKKAAEEQGRKYTDDQIKDRRLEWEQQAKEYIKA